MRVKVIGCGGIAEWLLPLLCMYLQFQLPETEVTILDGDSYESSNRNRQSYKNLQNKAVDKVAILQERFPSLLLRAIPEFITDKNVYQHIEENDIVLVCVDNHASRKLISARCEDLDNVRLISGGNGETKTTVQVYIRKEAEDITPALETYPEIAHPEDRRPDQLGCGERAIQSPQICITNHFVASQMMAELYRILHEEPLNSEICGDILTNTSVRYTV